MVEVILLADKDLERTGIKHINTLKDAKKIHT